jgi:hypothetical protein
MSVEVGIREKHVQGGAGVFIDPVSQFCNPVKKPEWPIGPKSFLDPVKGTHVFIHVYPA